MLVGQTNLSGVVDALQACDDGHLRVALEHSDGAWLARSFLFEASPAAACLPIRRGNYGDVALLAGPCRGSQLAGWLTEPGDFLGQSFAMPRVNDQVSVQQHASLSTNGIAPLVWPFTQYELRYDQASAAGLSQFAHQDMLVARNDAPSFRSLRFAINQFFFGIDNDTGYGVELLVRIARTDAWIEHIHFTPTAIRVKVSGDAVIGCRLELLASASDHLSAAVNESSTVEWPLPRGLPQHSQLLLSCDGVWRDDRYLDAAHRVGRPDFSSESGDPATDVEAVIAAGETISVEFKRELPVDPSSRRNAMKTVAAFANGEGGTVVFGVADDGTLVGVPDAAAACDTVSDLVRAWLAPVPPYHPEVVEVGGCSLLVLTVGRGGQDPCAIRMHRQLEYFVRRGATTFAAEPHEVRAIVLARQPVTVATRPW